MSIDEMMLKPVYLKNSEIQSSNSGSKISDFDIVQGVQKVVGDNVRCVQIDRDLWRVYLVNKESRDKILIEGFELKNQTANVYDTNPYSSGSLDPNDKVLKVTIAGVPLSVHDSAIYQMLDKLNVKRKSELKFEKIRDPKSKKMTSVLNGNRFLYVEPLSEEKYLPRVSYCAGLRCRIYHQGQPKRTVSLFCNNCWSEGHSSYDCQSDSCCKVCKNPGHFPGDEECPHYQKQNNVECFQGKSCVLSNFYESDIKVFGETFPSAEHAFQHTKALRSGDLIAAERITTAKTSLEALQIGKMVSESPQWKDTCENVMREIIEKKSEQLQEFRDKLLKCSKGTVFAECTYNNEWATGLDQAGTLNTAYSKWPGKNKLGKIMGKVAEQLKKVEGHHSSSRVSEQLKRKSMSKSKTSTSRY